MNYYTKKLELPSNGKLGAPKEVTIRNMTTLEEKILSNARDEKFLFELVKSCIVEPEGFDPYVLHANDLFFIIYQIRELTFGPEYTQPWTCPICGEQQDVLINIGDFEYNLLEDDLEDKLTLILPKSGDKVTLKILMENDLKECEKLAKYKANKYKSLKYDDALYVEKLCAHVVSIELAKPEQGKEALLTMRPEREQYLMNMHFADVTAIRNRLNDIKFGVNNVVHTNCEFCGEEMEVPGTFSPEFFRPSMD